MSAGVLLWILGWNVAAFCLMGVDKWKAKHGRWRLPEKVLFLSALAGGAWRGCACSATRPATGPFAWGCRPF